MNASPWYRSLSALLLASVLLPPLGLILLWARAGTGMGKKILGSLAIAVIGAAHLVALFGLRMELDGTGMRPIFSFHKPASHYRAIERARAEQQASPAAAPAAAATPEAAAAPVSETKAAPAIRAYWTDFRGPARDGRYDEMSILTEWPAKGLSRLWRQPIGGGYASFVVAGGKAFTIEQRRQQEVVAAYDVETGRELWKHGWGGEFQEAMGGDGPRATPTWHEGRLYALGALGEFRCIDAQTGRLLWSKNILSENQAPNLQWGMAASPLIVDEKVIVLPGGSQGKSVVAYHKVSGQRIWSALDDKQAYTSPIVATLAGRRQLLVVSAQRAMGLAIEDGALLWDYPWTTEYDVNAAQPLVAGENRFFISAGYDHGAALVEVAPSGDRFAVRAVWSNNRMKNKFSGSVLHNGHIYGLDEGILAAVDVATGERRWKGGRYGHGQVLLASGHLIVLTETGDLVLVEATPERHNEVARFSAIDGKTWNNHALAGGRLLVRNTTEMACFRIAAR